MIYGPFRSPEALIASLHASLEEPSLMDVPFKITSRGRHGYEVTVTKVTKTSVEGFHKKGVFKVRNHGEYFKRGGGSTSGINRFYYADIGDGKVVISKLRKAKIMGAPCHLTIQNVRALLAHIDGN